VLASLYAVAQTHTQAQQTNACVQQTNAYVQQTHAYVQTHMYNRHTHIYNRHTHMYNRQTQIFSRHTHLHTRHTHKNCLIYRNCQTQQYHRNCQTPQELLLLGSVVGFEAAQESFVGLQCQVSHALAGSKNQSLACRLHSL
jgi:uncharacterized protein (DUF3084 family)